MRRTPNLCKNPDGRAFSTIPGSGRKRVYFGLYGSEDAERAYRKWLGQFLVADSLPVPEPVAGPRDTIATLVQSYLDFAVKHYAKGGVPTAEYRNMRDAMRILLRYNAGDLAASFGPRAFRSLRSAMSRDGWVTRKGEKRTFNARTVNSYAGRIRRFFRWCESRELIPFGTTHALETVEPLRAGKANVTPVAWETVVATLPFCRDDLAAMIQVQYWAAMRPSEACRLSVSQIDRDGDVWLYRPDEHKNEHRGQELVKAIPTPAQEILRPFIARAASDAEPLFRTRFNRPYKADTYGTAIDCAIRSAKDSGFVIPKWSPNQLRHAIAERVDALAGREAAQHYLGHSRPDTTAIYARRSIESLHKTAEALGRSA